MKSNIIDWQKSPEEIYKDIVNMCDNLEEFETIMAGLEQLNENPELGTITLEVKERELN